MKPAKTTPHQHKKLSQSKIKSQSFSTKNCDLIDEAMRESFPTSDPPPWTLGKKTKLPVVSDKGRSISHILTYEHHLIRKVMAALGQLITMIESGNHTHVSVLNDLNEFLRDFIVECNHKKEEMIFPALQTTDNQPSAYMMNNLKNEHELGRQLFTKLEKTTAQYAHHHKNAEAELVAILKQLQSLYMNHLAKEGEYILPFINKTIPLAKRKVLWVKFKKIDAEAGNHTHQHMTRLAEMIVKKIKQ